MNRKYIKICGIILFILLVSAGYGGYKYYNSKSYNKLIHKADSYMKNGQYKEAVDAYKEALKYKNDYNAEKSMEKSAEKLNESLKSEGQEKNNIADEKDNVENKINNITKEQAVELTSKYYKDKDENTKFVFDHETVRDNETYYVIQVFDNMEDHSATAGWYYVNKKNGKVYEWDLVGNKLVPVN